MHPRIIAERQAKASKRVSEAIQRIASDTGVDAPNLVSIREKSPEVQRVKEWEALAEWLEGLGRQPSSKGEIADLEDQVAGLTAQIEFLKAGSPGPPRIMHPSKDDPNTTYVNMDAFPVDAVSITLEDGSVISRGDSEAEEDKQPPTTVETVVEKPMETTETVQVVDHKPDATTDRAKPHNKGNSKKEAKDEN
jgi:hypothetical protein